MTPSAVAEAYDRLLELTYLMLEKAQQQEWEDLIAHETEYVLQSQHVASLDAGVATSEVIRDHKEKQLEKILATNLEVRDLLKARHEELRGLIGSAQRQKSLSRTYGTQGRVHQLDPARMSRA